MRPAGPAPLQFLQFPLARHHRNSYNSRWSGPTAIPAIPAGLAQGPSSPRFGCDSRLKWAPRSPLCWSELQIGHPEVHSTGVNFKFQDGGAPVSDVWGIHGAWLCCGSRLKSTLGPHRCGPNERASRRSLCQSVRPKDGPMSTWPTPRSLGCMGSHALHRMPWPRLSQSVEVEANRFHLG